MPPNDPRSWSKEMENVAFITPPAPRVSQILRNCATNDFLVTLMAMAGHDLRQPLQLITNACDQLATMPLTERQREEVTQAADATAQLAGMLDQLVEAVQLHERAGDDLAAPVLIGPTLEDLKAGFSIAADLKQIHFQVANSPDAVLSHPVLLAGILRNLVRNAIDYTPPGGSVLVTSRQCGSELHIGVHDTGVGISAASLPKIFDAFERSDRSRSDGLGLGLFIARQAADLLGHRIDVQPAAGSGSCFTLRATRLEQFRVKRVA